MPELTDHWAHSWRRAADTASVPIYVALLVAGGAWPLFGAVAFPIGFPLLWFAPRLWDIYRPAYALSGDAPWPRWWRVHRFGEDAAEAERSRLAAGRAIVWLDKCREMSWIAGWLGLFGLWHAPWVEWRFALAVGATASSIVAGVAVRRFLTRAPSPPKRLRLWVIGLAASSIAIAVPCLLAGFEEFFRFLARGVGGVQSAWESVTLVFLGGPVMAAAIVVGGLLFLPRRLRDLEEAAARGEVRTAVEAINHSTALQEARIEAATRTDAGPPPPQEAPEA